MWWFFLYVKPSKGGVFPRIQENCDRRDCYSIIALDLCPEGNTALINININ